MHTHARSLTDHGQRFETLSANVLRKHGAVSRELKEGNRVRSYACVGNFETFRNFMQKLLGILSFSRSYAVMCMRTPLSSRSMLFLSFAAQ
jgi:hypothetical protein